MNRLLPIAALLAALLAILPGPAPAAAPEPVPGPFPALVKRLSDQSLDMDMVLRVYADERVFFDVSAATGYFGHRESKLDYGSFLSEKRISEAREYLKEHHQALKQAQETYGVDPEVIVAVLLVESSLGRYTGKRLVLTTLSTLADLARQGRRDFLWEEALSRDPELSREDFDSWCDRKSAWAFSELVALFGFCQSQDLDPLALTGSYAGALGFSQFMPSSAVKHAADGDRDGTIDLYSHEDAAASIASYLKNHGYEPLMVKRKLEEVLLTYNKSLPYVHTLIAVRSRLMGLAGR
ncbi:MAG: lytic murein transglycosylase [Thermodesulfobacteriota bacterium]